MLRYVAGRAGQAVGAVFLALTAVFFMVRITGDPVILFLPLDVQPKDIAHFRHLLGFDRPLWVQYAEFLGRAAHGDFGTSLRYRAPALRLVLQRLPATVQLAASSLALVALVAVPVGVLSAARRGTVVDHLGIAATALGQAIPGFWLGLMLIWVFGVWLRWLPVGGDGTWAHFARITRSAVLESLGQDYVRTARAKGVREARILLRHVLKNAAIPIVTVFGLNAGQLLGGAVVTETIFAWPGMGGYVLNALLGREFPVVMVGGSVSAVS